MLFSCCVVIVVYLCWQKHSMIEAMPQWTQECNARAEMSIIILLLRTDHTKCDIFFSRFYGIQKVMLSTDCGGVTSQMKRSDTSWIFTLYTLFPTGYNANQYDVVNFSFKCDNSWNIIPINCPCQLWCIVLLWSLHWIPFLFNSALILFVKLYDY